MSWYRIPRGSSHLVENSCKLWPMMWVITGTCCAILFYVLPPSVNKLLSSPLFTIKTWKQWWCHLAVPRGSIIELMCEIHTCIDQRRDWFQTEVVQYLSQCCYLVVNRQTIFPLYSSVIQIKAMVVPPRGSCTETKIYFHWPVGAVLIRGYVKILNHRLQANCCSIGKGYSILTHVLLFKYAGEPFRFMHLVVYRLHYSVCILKFNGFDIFQ